MSTVLLNKLKIKSIDFNASFEQMLKIYLIFLSIFALIDYLFFEISLTTKAQIYVASCLIFIILISFNLILNRNRFIELFTRKYNSLNEFLFIIDLILLSGSILLALRLSNDINFSKVDYFLIMNLFCIWFLCGLSFKSFFPNTNIYYWKFIWRHLKTHFVLTYSIIILCILFEVNFNTLYTMVLITLVYNFSNFLIYTIRYFYLLPAKDSDDRFLFILPKEVQNITNPDNVLYKEGIYSLGIEKPLRSVEEKLEKSLQEYDNLFYKFERVLDLKSIDLEESLILRSADIFNIKNNSDNSLKLVLNLHPLNDQRRINKYLIEVNKKLKYGGLYIGCFQTIRNRYKKFLLTYPFFIGQLFYFFDFIWSRVFPKLPFFKGIYFNLSKGKNRAVSLAGGLGRLVYCGFDFIDVFDYGLLTFFIVYKKGEPKTDIIPSYGPIYAMPRIGKNGKEVKVLKFRTMHPYSEFLQEFVHKFNKLEDGGKFKDDFRISSWGRIFRKFWIDELPMIFNFLKGDLKLVGVRPLSKHYFELYPEELKQMRIKTKPGLVPPYYYDLPKSFDEIIESEKRYLKKYLSNPIKTDLEYLIKIFYNIVIKKARSK